jgi:hypothetical protein
MRCIVIADAHGQPWLIENALQHSSYDKTSDRLVFAGDFLDIGNQPDECLELLEENKAEMLYGNHEVAILLDKQIWPQNKVSWEFKALFQELVRNPVSRWYPDKPWRVATAHDDVLITHAGVSQVYWRLFEGLSVQDIAKSLNERFSMILDVPEIALDFWAPDSPLWFRPGLMAPFPGIVQVCGHTPAERLPKDDNYYSVDPYSSYHFDSKRFRYAIIENGEVTIHDSNEV